MAPDVLDLVVATLGNPLAGLGVAVKKVEEKTKEETKNSGLMKSIAWEIYIRKRRENVTSE